MAKQDFKLIRGTTAQAPISVEVVDQQVRMHFNGHAVSSVSFSPEVAIRVGEVLIARAKAVQEKRSPIIVPSMRTM